MSSKPIIAILATDNNGGIGHNNTLPWKLRSEMRHFVRTTTGNACIMGKNTWLSIGKPLPNRMNCVLSSQSLSVPEGVLVFSTIESAMNYLNTTHVEKIYIIGGKELYIRTANIISEVLITKIDHTYTCDCFIDLSIYDAFTNRTELSTGEENGVTYSINRWIT